MEDRKYFIAIFSCLWNYVKLYSAFIVRISRSSILVGQFSMIMKQISHLNTQIDQKGSMV